MPSVTFKSYSDRISVRRKKSLRNCLRGIYFSSRPLYIDNKRNILSTKLIPENIFTPRADIVDDEMYIKRLELETSLKKAIRKPKHIVLYGESGCGKTWLYQKVFEENNIFYKVLNSATINQCDSISNAIELIISRIEPIEETGYDEKKLAETNAVILKARVEHTKKYDKKMIESYLNLITLIRKKAKKQKAFLVIENLEHIVKNDAMLKELSSLVLYLDDKEYSQHNVRILLVGTPNNLRDYFAKADETQTVINRLQELPEVANLTDSQVRQFSNKGLFTKLKFTVIEDAKKDFNKITLLDLIIWFSTNVPQYVQDICLELAIEAEENQGEISRNLFLKSIKNWVQEALIAENTLLAKNANSKETRHGRRNQTIFTLGNISSNEFSINDIESKLRDNFFSSTQNKKLNLSAILIELSTGSHPILRKTPNGTDYRFIDPKIKIMIRWMFEKLEDEQITVKKFDESLKI